MDMMGINFEVAVDKAVVARVVGIVVAVGIDAAAVDDDVVISFVELDQLDLSAGLMQCLV